MERKQFEVLVDLLSKFPQIGERQAYRIAQYIIRQQDGYPSLLANAIRQASEETKQCPLCFTCHEESSRECAICSDKERDETQLAVVEKEVDISVIEKSGVYKGYYFVFESLIPIRFPEYVKKTRLTALLNRIKKDDISCLILAFSYHPDANHTTDVISGTIRDLNKENLTITIPGRGISSGLELEYADPETVKHAFERCQDITGT